MIRIINVCLRMGIIPLDSNFYLTIIRSMGTLDVPVWDAEVLDPCVSIVCVLNGIVLNALVLDASVLDACALNI